MFYFFHTSEITATQFVFLQHMRATMLLVIVSDGAEIVYAFRMCDRHTVVVRSGVRFSP